MSTFLEIRLALFAWFGLGAVASAGEAPALAVLERNCLSCHNAHDAKGDVILDSVPPRDGDLRKVLSSVEGSDPEMPKDRERLSPDDIAALRDWIENGAPIPEGRTLRDTYVPGRDWWSLKPISTISVPVPDAEEATEPSTWPRNEIDRFILAKLREKRLTPSPEADARTLVRRLTFDLTGLPPSPEQVRSFLDASAIDADAAYRDLVERLLASPRYGEQWARHWLDVARYGESHGYDKDKARFHAWPYRDYVIRSFNDDKPWTRFVQEQVAGDVLWPGDPDGIVALGFVAAGPWDFIAHTEVGEKKLDGRIAKHLDRDDMVSAVFNAFLSTTVQCAQCHHHKFDPVSMEDYYRLHTIFAAVDRQDRVYDLDPEVVTERVQLESKIGQLGQQLRQLENQIKEEGGPPLEALRKQVAELEKSSGAGLKTVPEHGYHSRIAPNQDQEKWVQVTLPETVEIAEIRLIGSHDDYAGIGAGFGFPVRYRLEIADDPGFSQNRRVLADRSQRDQPNPGVTPVILPGGKGSVVRVTATRLAERKGDYIFALAELQLLDRDGKNLALAAKVTAADSIEAGSRWGRNNLVDGRFATGADPEAVAHLAGAREKLDDLLARLETPERLEKRETLGRQKKAAEKALADLPKGKLVYSLATDFKPRSQVIPTKGVPRAIHLLHRGDLRTPGDRMAPGAPALWDGAPEVFELPPDHTEGDRRAALARYLVDPGNPLLWRSAVNRVWLSHFGRGIVDSPNDFGRMGMLPSHPELLDWLAARFRKTESLKDLHRLIVTSATYRQSSDYDAGQAAIDGSNAYYWRFNRRKLRAEELRDAVLSVAGVLDLEMGGPSFRDFSFKDDHTPKYWYHLHDPNDPDSHRRTIYRFIARSQTQPFLTTLDCADPSQMVAKRDETTTALQALVLMNNPFMTAMSNHLATRTKDVDEAVWLALGRSPTDDEKQALEAYASQHGMPATARLLFNLNEFTYVD